MGFPLKETIRAYHSPPEPWQIYRSKLEAYCIQWLNHGENFGVGWRLRGLTPLCETDENCLLFRRTEHEKDDDEDPTAGSLVREPFDLGAGLRSGLTRRRCVYQHG